jgi:hypothetical protein
MELRFFLNKNLNSIIQKVRFKNEPPCGRNRRVSKFNYPSPLMGGDKGEGDDYGSNHPHLTSPIKGEGL